MAFRRVAFLAISDLHERDGNFPARKSYKDELEFVYAEIKKQILKYRNEQDRRVVLLFLGDIFHKSYKVPDGVLESSNRVLELINLADDAYSVVGNHEITYSKNNPFWHMVDNLDTAPSLNQGYHVKKLEAKGINSKLKVVDRLMFGDTEFLFNHHGIPWHTPDLEIAKVTIGLFHQDVMVTELIQVMEDTYQHGIFDYGFDYMDSSRNLNGYDVALVGHNHMTYGKFIHEMESGHRPLIQWLASLNRSSVREINNRFLERDIPAIIMDDYKFIKMESNKFSLLSREETVFEDKVVVERNKRIRMKDRKRINAMLFDEDPFQNLVDTFGDRPEILDILESAKMRGLSSKSKELDINVKDILRGYI